MGLQKVAAFVLYSWAWIRHFCPNFIIVKVIIIISDTSIIRLIEDFVADLEIKVADFMDLEVSAAKVK